MSFAANHANPKWMTPLAKNLRQQGTAAEKRLWFALRQQRAASHFKFRRQQPIAPYIVDFVCFEAKLVVELDGLSHDAPEVQRKDDAKEQALARLGYQVLRFADHDVCESLDGVVQKILDVAQARKKELETSVPHEACRRSKDFPSPCGRG